jgi:hypothetical protein
LVAFGVVTSAWAGNLVPGVELGGSLAEVEPALRRQCASVEVDEVSPPVFPLARDRETHLLCRELETPRGSVARAVLLFGDEVLVAVEARGGAVRALADSESEGYLQFRYSEGGERWADEAGDAVWLLNGGARHLNLFTWSNPRLADDGPAPSYRGSAEIPPILDFERTLDEQLPLFEKSCPQLDVGRDERIWLPTQPERQAQVNCFGYEYAGFPRKLEAVYGDGRLDVVWILTGQGEEDRVRQALTAAFGVAISVNENWEAFADGRVALRKDKPEVLMLSESAAPHYRADIGLE